MKALIFPSRTEALARSRSAWVTRLGRPKKPEDVTEFLWDVRDHPVEADARAIMLVPDADVATRLDAEERTRTVDVSGAVNEEWFPDTVRTR